MKHKFPITKVQFFILFLALLSLGLLLDGIAYAAAHTDTQFQGFLVNGKTEIRMRVCGTGAYHRIGVVQLPAADAPSWDSGNWGAVNGCIPASPYMYQMVFNASPGEKFRFYSLVMDAPLSAAQFVQQARRDDCEVTAPGVISCRRVELRVSSTSLSFSATAGGGNPAAKSFTISADGMGPINWTAGDNAGWLTLNRSSGSTPATVSASVNINGLSAGTYNGRITVNSGGAWGSPKVINVSLVVNPPPANPILAVSPTSLSFSATAGGGNPAAKAFTISNAGSGGLNWTASDNAGWLTLSKTSGAAPATVNASASIGGLSPGTYSGKITVSSSGAQGSPKTVNVSLTVNPQRPYHADTRISASVENGYTTLWVEICGQGNYHRFRATQSSPVSSVLGEWTAGPVNGCTSQYRTVIYAEVGDRFHFHTTVIDRPLSEAAFLQQARRDSCTITAPGVVKCQQGVNYPAPPEKPNPSSKVLSVPYVDQVFAQQYPERGYWNYCGPAAVTMFAGHEGLESRDVFNNRAPAREMADQVLYTNQWGYRVASWGKINNYLNQKGFQASVQYSAPTFDQIKQSIQNDHPVIAGFDAPWSHVVLIVGYRDPNIIIVNDPMGGPYWSPSWVNDPKRNDAPWVNGFPTPSAKGQNVEYVYGPGGITAARWARISGRYSSLGAASAIVGSDGGLLLGDRLRVEVPPDPASQLQALGQTTTLSYTISADTAAPAGYDGVLAAFRLEAGDETGRPLAQLGRPVSLTVELNPSVIDYWEAGSEITPAGEQGAAQFSAAGAAAPLRPSLTLAYRDPAGQEWITVPANVDFETYRLTAQTDRLAEFAVFIQAAPPDHKIFLPLVIK